MASEHSQQRKTISSSLTNQKLLSSPPRNASSREKGALTLFIYIPRLPANVEKALIVFGEAPVTIKVKTEHLISILAIRDIPFKSHPATDNYNDTVRGICFCRCSSNIQKVCLILGDIELVENWPRNYKPKMHIETSQQNFLELKNLGDTQESTPRGKRQRIQKNAPGKCSLPTFRQSTLSS